MSIQKKLSKFVRSSEFIVFAILVLVMCAFSLMNPAFLTVRNMFDLLRTMIVTGIFACGDCTGEPLQLSKAAGEGLIAGQKAAEYVDALHTDKTNSN